MDIQSRFVHALRTQARHKAEPRLAGPLPCLYGHSGRVFQDIDQLLNHLKAEHVSELTGLDEKEARLKVRQAIIELRQAQQSASSKERVTAPDIAALLLDSDNDDRTPLLGRKRRADPSTRVEITNPGYSRDLRYATKPTAGNEPRKHHSDARLYNPRHSRKGTTLRREHPETTPGDSNSIMKQQQPPNRQPVLKPTPSGPPRRPGLIELQKYDPRYPGLLLQPDSRRVSQEQLASEVKSIYAGLTMVETKCIHVDRAQAAAPQVPSQELASDHWQALITLHRTLLREHHDFFLASQHPSAAPALRRLAAKRTLSARMWKHGIHSVLELLQRRTPEKLDYIALMTLPPEIMSTIEDNDIDDDLLRHSFPAGPQPHRGGSGRGTSVAPLFGQSQSQHRGEELFQTRPGPERWTLHLRSLRQRIQARNSALSRYRQLLVVLFLTPKAAAATVAVPPPPLPSTGSLLPGSEPLLVDKTLFDYIMWGLAALYLLSAFLAPPLVSRLVNLSAGQKTHDAMKWFSFAFMIAMGGFWAALMGDSLAAGIYTTVFKIWAATFWHFIVVDCVDAADPRFHVAKFLGFAVLTELIGMGMQQLAAQSALKALPPSLAAAAFMNWGLDQLAKRAPLGDIERDHARLVDNHGRGEESQATELGPRPHRQQAGIIGASQPRRRNSLRLANAESRSVVPRLNIAASDNHAVVTATAPTPHFQQTGTVNEASRQSNHNPLYPQDELRHPDYFVIGPDSDDSSSLTFSTRVS